LAFVVATNALIIFSSDFLFGSLAVFSFVYHNTLSFLGNGVYIKKFFNFSFSRFSIKDLVMLFSCVKSGFAVFIQ